ncbi:DUF397 domain-containing protein [Streptomyces sp. NPDC057654]|uniref:DUF397 domain-containing protein n=1 Tax=Streptomyces sp. NPDC057654 TaxID=3346196 RepID=UPI0036757363
MIRGHGWPATKGALVTTKSPRWAKSTYSGPEGGNCVEWAPIEATARGVVAVRDSKNSSGPALKISTTAWTEFVAFVRATGK